MNVVDFFIMGNELGKYSLFLYVPYRACSVDWTRSDKIWNLWIPIKRS